jgi:carbonic anhydrase
VSELLPFNRLGDDLSAYRNMPVAYLLAYHSLRRPHRSDRAEFLIGMRMDNRVALRIPENFAYILRAGGANFQRIEFNVSYAVAVGSVRTICLIGHDECGMVDLRGRRDVFVNGLVENGGWERLEVEEHFDHFSVVVEIPDSAAFVLSEARRLREGYPRVMVAPLLYRIREGLMYQIAEGEQTLSSAMRSWPDVLRHRGTRLCYYASACLPVNNCNL